MYYIFVFNNYNNITNYNTIINIIYRIKMQKNEE